MPCYHGRSSPHPGTRANIVLWSRWFCLHRRVGRKQSAMVKKIEQKNYDLSSVKGIGFKNQEKIIVNDDWQIVSNLDSIPLPGRELLSSEISYTSEDMGVIMSSRGCPFKCSFCSHIVRTRYHPVDRVIEEIKKVIDKYGTSHFSC